MELKFMASFPWHPCPSVKVPGEFDFKKVQEVLLKSSALIAKSVPNDIITSDPTPQWVHDAFYDIAPRLGPILKKDSVRCFLRLLVNNRGMAWDLTITPQTLTYMISHDAIRCAKVVLEGKAPELNGQHANPNCINPYGFFPLHEAAERFSVEMIKLLFRHGASANVRTFGNGIIEGLLPLHVAVENTCLHKYLEDNLFPNQNSQDYIYKIIHLLCLPEMKVFLDTTRLLAEKTDNLVDELWNYMKDGKLIQSAVMLLAAQKQIRGGCSSKRNGNGNSKRDGFDIIMHRLVRHSVFLRWENTRNASERKQLEEKRKLMDCTGLLIYIISQAGEKLSAHIQAHSEVPHEEILERVSSILKEFGFCSTGKVIEAENLRPYECMKPNKVLCQEGLINSTKAVAETTKLHAADGKAQRKKIARGWDPTYTRRRFFPFWRSVLRSKCPVKVYPSYAAADARFALYHSNSMASGSTPVPSDKSCLLGRVSQPTSNQPSGRLFGTGGSMILKLLRKA